MRAVHRTLTATLQRAARAFGAVILIGPRRTGKTFALRRVFPRASYVLFEDPDVVARFRADPRSFLDEVALPAIFDEVQNVPEIFSHVRSRIDAAPRKKGRFLFTSSQDFALMAGATESMAGRAAVLSLLPFGVDEIGDADPFLGGFPEVRARPKDADLWFRSYVQTYLERDVRAVTAVRDLATFRRFMGLLATRSAHMLNRTDLAAPLGVSVPTISQWISVLETTGVVLVVPPYYDNLGKRLVKSPKIYFSDSGLLCHLLGLSRRSDLDRSPLAGPVFETFVAAELVKSRIHHGLSRELYYFRDESGLEVDFLVPREAGGVALVDAKWSRTPTPADARGIVTLLPRIRDRAAEGFVVHRGGGSAPSIIALTPGARALSADAFFARGGPAHP